MKNIIFTDNGDLEIISRDHSTTIHLTIPEAEVLRRKLEEYVTSPVYEEKANSNSNDVYNLIYIECKSHVDDTINKKLLIVDFTGRDFVHFMTCSYLIDDLKYVDYPKYIGDNNFRVRVNYQYKGKSIIISFIENCDYVFKEQLIKYSDTMSVANIKNLMSYISEMYLLSISDKKKEDNNISIDPIKEEERLKPNYIYINRTNNGFEESQDIRIYKTHMPQSSFRFQIENSEYSNRFSLSEACVLNGNDYRVKLTSCFYTHDHDFEVGYISKKDTIPKYVENLGYPIEEKFINPYQLIGMIEDYIRKFESIKYTILVCTREYTNDPFRAKILNLKGIDHELKLLLKKKRYNIKYNDSKINTKTKKYLRILLTEHVYAFVKKYNIIPTGTVDCTDINNNDIIDMISKELNK